MQWDIFCRVIDNLGDVGVCWRLAADLAARGERVRLWIDDASALRWMAPDGAPGVAVHAWPAETDAGDPGDVVIEAFGCELPVAFIGRMAASPRPPVWINLEYLSAQDYVARNHRLPSPRLTEPGAGLMKWFFYPGFTPNTGGLIREPGLMQRRQAFDANAWLRGIGVMPAAQEQIVSLFCYDQPALPALIDQWARRPTLLLATAGLAGQQVTECLGPELRRGALRARVVPALSQTDYDHLLWSCDLNLVRGEDSFVRAQWAGVPFIWQAYRQDDAAHLDKVAAFLGRFLRGAPAPLAADIERLWTGWNGDYRPPIQWPDHALWQRHCADWCTGLLAQTDLTGQLLRFASETR